MNHSYQIKNLYRLPWTKENNPTGWIEVTTFCQLKCPGCYRGLAEENPNRIHEDFKQVVEDIDKLITNRNIQTLAIAGGEPLIYPKIKEVISYANSKKLRTRIFTNGLALTKKKLEELKLAGATEFVIHIDQFQKRYDLNNLKNTNELRKKYCELFREVGGVNLGFILPVSIENYEEMKDVIDLAKENPDVINLVVLTPYKDILPNDINSFKDNEIKSVGLEEIAETIMRKYNVQPNSFLGKVLDKDRPSWMFFMPVFYANKIVGQLDASVYEIIQNRYYKKNGRYMVTSKSNKINPKSLIPLAFKKSIVKILYNFSKEGLSSKDLKFQTLLIIDGPEKINGRWNLCDGCPDAMYYNKRLVPSCLLERVKSGEEILI